MEVVKNYSDQELIQALQSSQTLDDAIRFVYRKHFEFLTIYVTQNQGSSEDAEDVFQEVVITFVELVQKGKFRGESSIKTFLYSINRHIWLNELKKRGRAINRDIAFEGVKDKTDEDASRSIMLREARKQVMQVVDSLGETCKKILVAFYYDNLSMKDILENLDYENEQVIRNKKYKCLKQLEQLLAENPGLAKNFKSALYYE